MRRREESGRAASFSQKFELLARFGHADVTPVVRDWVAASGVETGQVALQAVGSTAGLTTIEYESGALADLERAVETMAPVAGRYAHDARWGDGNGYSHLRSALIGTHMTLPVVEGLLQLGTWQQIVLINFDARPRSRPLVGVVLGG